MEAAFMESILGLSPLLRLPSQIAIQGERHIQVLVNLSNFRYCQGVGMNQLFHVQGASEGDS